MPEPDNSQATKVPARALILSLAALLVPVLADLFLPREVLGTHQPLLWLSALLPAFLLAYYRGWRGAATALAVGMVTLSLTQAVANWLGRPVPDLLGGVVVAYLAITMGIGWLAQRLHRDRSEVEDLAFTDLLTHLPNRRHARVFLENEFAAAERGRLLSVVLFDLDHFKQYNDRYGHVAGDQALAAFADILAQTTRRMNLSARFGGEEFLTILAGSDVEGALVFAERVRSSLRTEKLPHGALTVSAGVAAHHPSMRSPDELLAAADHALYQAKREGRNCVRLFGRTLVEEAVAEAQEEHPPQSPHNGTAGYPRSPDDLGRRRPPVTLLPHQVTGFGADRKVLLVEDEKALKDLLTSYLEKEGFAVVSTPDVTSAIEELGNEYDVLITDLRLPGRWGVELVTAAKARWPATQVLVITTIQDAQATVEAMGAGADRYLQKPFGMPELRGELVEALARRDRILMERSRNRLLSAEGRERRDRSRGAILEGTEALVRAVEIRDPFLQGHHEAVARFAEELGKELDPHGQELAPDSLRTGARLVDLGKIGIPPSLLTKPDSLTVEETEVMEGHPHIGRTILGPLLDDEEALGIVSWHHERWDGSGYPNGLLGEAIPFGARIAALADALAAMTAPRSYREALSWEETVEEVRRGREGQFDPRVVDALEASLPRLEKIYRERGTPPPPSTTDGD
jgi:diguanylate cyclase (GGDEF)-like protein